MTRRPVKIAASVLSADFLRLGEEVRKAECGGADVIHVDVMDGRFVPNMTVGPMVVKAVRQATSLPVDVHLMVENPDWFVRELEGSNVNMISVHAEAARHLSRTLRKIREAGARAGVALSPPTPLEALECSPEEMDYLLITAVNPGFGGQAFLLAVLPKIEGARKRLEKAGLDIDIEVDGGINTETAAKVVRAGATVLVSGSAIYGTGDVSGAIARLRESVRVFPD